MFIQLEYKLDTDTEPGHNEVRCTAFHIHITNSKGILAAIYLY